jgi:hypothetical protein
MWRTGRAAGGDELVAALQAVWPNRGMRHYHVLAFKAYFNIAQSCNTFAESSGTPVAI